MTTDSALRGMRVVQSTLQSAVSDALLGTEHLKLCSTSEAVCTPVPTLGPHTVTPLWLRLDAAFNDAGEFAGTVTMAADRGTPVNVELVVLASSRARRLLGGLAMALGLLLAWYVAIGLRNRAARANALIPVAELREPAKKLHTELTKLEAPPAARGIQEAIDACITGLSEKQLEAKGLIPRRWGNPMGLPDGSSTLAQRLGEIAIKISALTVLVREGVTAAMRRAAPPETPKELSEKIKQKISEAIAALSAVANDVGTVAEARQDVTQSLAILDQEIAKLAPSKNIVPESARVAVRGDLDVKELSLVLTRLSLSMWGVWAILTLLLGSATLLTSHSFGAVWLDYMKCFLWGLGVQVAGQQFQQLSPTPVATTFNVVLPK